MCIGLQILRGLSKLKAIVYVEARCGRDGLVAAFAFGRLDQDLESLG